MISTTLPVAQLCKNQVIALGRQMENNYRQIIFDVSDFSETITSIMLVHQRKGDVAPYIVDTISGDQFVWTITNTDTAYYGYGQGEIRINFDNGLAKSYVFTTMVIKSITGDTEIPEPLQSWYDAMIEYIDDHAASPEQIEAAVEAYLEEHPIPAPVTSVNSKTGDVVLTASDVGALSSSTTFVSSFNGSTGAVTYTAPVTSVNTQTGAVTLTASDVGALSSSTTFVSSFNGSTGAVTYTAPVTSVNSQTGAVSLSASDVGALPSTYTAPVTSVNTRTGAVTGLAEEWTIENKTSADTSVTLTTGKFYIFPEMSSLAVTVTAVGMYAFRFTSGTTPTTLTVTGATMPDSFTVEASKVYEVNVYQGYAVVQSWTSS